MQKVLLTPGEVELARRIADIRNSKNNQVPNYKVTRSENDWIIHYVGAMGEVASCKYYDYIPDIHFSYGGDNGLPDLYIGKNKEISAEVKTPMSYPPILYLNKLELFKTDIMILCYIQPQNNKNITIVELHGIITKSNFLKNYYMRDFGYGKRFCVDKNKLTSVKILKDRIENN
jgi:hypothetical protein